MPGSANDLMLISRKGLPTADWLRALNRLLRLAEEEAEDRGFPLIIERSDCSESRYIHVNRDEAWFGVRIASHLPRYACSRDYYQILLEDPTMTTAVEFTCRQLRHLVASGGAIVASPNAIRLEIRRRALDRIAGKFSRREVAVLRHQLNQRAKWLADLSDIRTSMQRPTKLVRCSHPESPEFE